MKDIKKCLLDALDDSRYDAASGSGSEKPEQGLRSARPWWAQEREESKREGVVCCGGVVLWSVAPGQALDAAAPCESVAMVWPRVREGEREGRV